ncbi:hypothetical protein F5Y09DRAFT_349748 [Xylaria sp. FL1042]|nr:hypothetical protein F5Y09DRAFT_349748 [Xylaria sp. FL1042]
MWLLNTDKLDRPELVEVAEESAPRYAILSHTWGKEEVTFQDMQALGRRQWSRAVSQTALTIQNKKGFVKIRKAAALAAEHGHNYIWVDTCCIDKTSSAELSEAINSMFRWYKKASICYAYMEDVKHGYHDSKGGLFSLLCQESRWFTRGWTLQELIAPEDVMFYGGDWGYLGSKAHDEDVRGSLAEITGIDVRVLEGIIQPSEISIAARMKWASQRRTTRLEDAAYCLMGLFDVNMPLLYGEGTKAFIRLQEEILRSSNDHSIFAWKVPGAGPNEVLSGLLAETPLYFSDVGNYRPMPPSVSQGSTAWSTTNQGLQLSLFLVPCQDWNGNDIQDEYDAVLECAIRRGDEAYSSPAIRMRRLYGDQFARVDPHIVKRVATPSFDPSQGRGSFEIVFVKQKPVYAVPDFMVSFSNILHSPEPQENGSSCHVTKVWPEKYWDEEAATLRTMPSPSNRIIGLFRFFAPTIAATVDFAVGLRRKPGGAWIVWHLQRPSTGEPLHQTVTSANGYLAAANENQLPPLRPPDWLEHPWQEAGESQRIQVRVEETTVHGRTYHFVKALSAIELPSIPKSPSKDLSSSEDHTITPSKWPYTFGFEPPREKLGRPERPETHSLKTSTFPTTAHVPLLKAVPPLEPPTKVETMHLEKPPSVEGLMESITMPNSIDYYLDLGHLTLVGERRSKIRTIWDYPPAKDLENLEIQGLGEMETKLLRACKNGRSQEVSELIYHDLKCLTWLPDQPYSANSIKFNGFQPIHWAVVGGHIEIIRTLLNNGVDFYSRTLQGWSPLHLAALFGRFVTMKWLIEYATEKRMSSYGSLLDDRNNPLLESPLHLAVSHVSIAVGDEIMALIEILENVRGFIFWTLSNHAGETPLHRLAASGSLRSPTNLYIMENFLSYEHQFQYPSKYVDELGRTVLWHAVCAGSAPEVEYLLQNGAANLSMEDKTGISPLHAACRLGHAEVSRVLLQAGADPNATTNTTPGLTPAHFAAVCDYPDCLQELITYGADIHKSTESEEISFQPIHLAAANRYGKSLRILRDAGGDAESICTHYILRSANSHGGQVPYQYKLLEYDEDRDQNFMYSDVGLLCETPSPIVPLKAATTGTSPSLSVPGPSPRSGTVQENSAGSPPLIPSTSNEITNSAASEYSDYLIFQSF